MTTKATSDVLSAELDIAFAAFADRPALIDETGAAMTYAQLNQMANRYAHALAASGVGPGDRVMVQVAKSVSNLALYIATLKAGAVYNPLNTAYTPAELDYFMGDAEPSLLVIDPKAADALLPLARQNAVGAVRMLDANGDGDLADLAADQSDAFETVPRAASDLAALLYTSGTTGRSKGAMITHENLASNARTLVELWRFTADDRLLHALPIFHVHGLFVASNVSLLAGASMIWLPRFDADQVVDLMPQATAMMGVPTFYTRLLATDRFTKDAAASMRLFVSGSAPLLAETHDAFADRTGHRILERYGMTEAGMITSNPYKGERRAGTVGYALDRVSVRIADECGTEQGVGDVGVLEVKGPNVFAGYWRNPEKTAEDFREDGYFISGDLATAEEDGRITIVGRAKDLIISGGYNVYPKEIETELNDLAGISESAVIGVPHADFGEGVVAVVTLAPGEATLSEEAILSQLEGRLAKFKLPKRILIADELPRNAMGKVQKNVLRDAHAALLTS